MDAQTSQLPNLIPLRQIAKRFQKHPVTIMRWARDGLIPGPIRVGRTIYFDEAAVSAALKQIGHEAR